MLTILAQSGPPGSRHALELKDDVRARRRRGAYRGRAVVRRPAAEGQQRDDRHDGAGSKRESSDHGTLIVRPRARQPQGLVISAHSRSGAAASFGAHGPAPRSAP